MFKNAKKQKNILNEKKKKFSLFYIFCFVILLIYVVGLVLPLLWGLFISLIPSKDYNTYLMDIFKIPNGLTFANYWHGLLNFSMVPANQTQPIYLPQILLYTVLYAGGCAFLQTLTPFIVSYLAARYDFKFSKVLYAIVVIVMAVPIIGSLPSEIVVAKTLGIFDHIWGMWIMKINFLGIYFLVFHGIFEQIPRDYTESAAIDGANDFYIMTRVIFPQAYSTFGIVFLINFINYWNDYQTPNYYLPNYPVVGTSIFNFSKTLNLIRYTDPVTGKLLYGYLPQLLAMIFIVAIPIIVLAIVFNKKMMANLSDGGLKE